MAAKVTQVMNYERTTKGSHLYSAPYGDTAQIRNQYVKKDCTPKLEGGKPPKTITVTVDFGDEPCDEVKT